jgi:hypothetical protein
MTDAEVEAWAGRIIDRIGARSPIEDSKVELKTTWIDGRDAARRLAGQANAVRSDAVLWLVGVDEKAGAVPGAPPQELANWLPAAKSHFDGLAPELVNHMNLDISGVTVVALLFDVRGTPYVVKTAGGEVTHEVPWREGTRVFSANRQQLLRLLSRAQVPAVEVGATMLTAGGSDAETGYRFTWSLRMDLYLTPANDQPLVIRHSDCRGTVTFAATSFVLDLASIALIPEADSATVQRSGSQVVITGPAALLLISQRAGVPIPERPVGTAHLTVTLPIWQADSPLIVTADLPQQLTGQPGAFRWSNGLPLGVFP